MNEQYQPNDAATWPVMICLLGDFRLLSNDQFVPVYGGGKAEALLSYLGLQYDQRILRERIIQMLWPTSEPALGLQSLNSLVYSLHRLLGPALHGLAPVLYEEGYYRLNVEAGIGVDVVCFDRLSQIGDQQAHAGDLTAANLSYRHAVELYRGDLCVAPDAQTVVERERLRARYLKLLAQLADYQYCAGDYTACLEYIWRLLARDPCREDAHRLVMQCYVRRGERATALRHYRICVDILRAEFDATPEPATVALFEQIRLHPDTI